MSTSASARPDITARALALSPFVVTALMIVLVPGYLDRLLAEPPSWLGIPFGVALVGLMDFVALIGATFIWENRGPIVTGLALALTTAPAIVMTIMIGPLIAVMTYLAI